MTTFTVDRQTRVTRFGVVCFQIFNGIKCHAYAHATKQGKNLIVSDLWADCFDINGNSVSGVYKIVSIGNGKIASVICEKIK